MDVFSRLRMLGMVACAFGVALAAEMPLTECREKAAAGNAEAQWQMGRRYELGDGVAKNSIRAIIQYRKAAEQGHRKACEKLSELYSRGELVQKDSVRAAKYRAMADGDSAGLAAAKAETAAKKEKQGEATDEIETSLDYIFGRNGKMKDPKAGIRILYGVAQERPIAKVVFVKRWEQGDLDSALSVLTDKEWSLIESWFQQAFDAGHKKCGLILGNREVRNNRHEKAATYYLAAGQAGLPKAWYYLGCLYWTGSDKERWGTPRHLQSDRKALEAFERAVRIDPEYRAALWDLGRLYLFSDDKQCTDFQRAFRIFSEFYKSDRKDRLNVYYYGLSGYFCALGHKTQRDYTKLKQYEEIIQRAANMGCEAAKRFLEQIRQRRGSL